MLAGSAKQELLACQRLMPHYSQGAYMPPVMIDKRRIFIQRPKMPVPVDTSRFPSMSVFSVVYL